MPNSEEVRASLRLLASMLGLKCHYSRVRPSILYAYAVTLDCSGGWLEALCLHSGCRLVARVHDTVYRCTADGCQCALNCRNPAIPPETLHSLALAAGVPLANI